MKEIGMYWTVAVTILSIAFPILFQIYSRLDEKYESDHIVELFNLEPAKWCFNISLFTSLIICVIFSLNLPPSTNIVIIDEFLANSATVLLVISIISMVCCFFWYV